MAIDYTTLRARWGKIIGALNEVNTYRGTTLAARVTTLISQFSSANPSVTSGIYDAQTSALSSFSSWLSYLTGLVNDALFTAVNNDRSVPFTDIDACGVELVRQMTNDAQTFNDSPCSYAFAAVGVPTGDLSFVYTDRDATGLASDYAIPDRLLFTVTADADRGGTRWAETIAVVGKLADTAATDAGYPTGAGINTTIQVTDPDVSGGAVTDGSFNNYTSSNFDSWTRLTGNTSSTVNQAAEDYRNGANGKSLNLVSNGTNVTGVRQNITVTAGQIKAVCFRVKAVNSALTTAKVHVSIRRQDTDALLTDPQSANLQTSSGTMAGIGVGSWAAYTAVFVMPNYIPSSGVYLDIRLADGTTVTTPATVATAAYVDHVSIIDMPAQYNAGPRIVIFSGKTGLLITDQWQLTITLASGTISGYIVRGVDRLIGLRSRTWRLPTVSGGTETLTDAAIS